MGARLKTSVVVIALLTSGCVGSADPGEQRSQDDSQTVTATPLPDQVTASFRGIAQTSCDRANAIGVVEETTGPRNFRQVLLPPDLAYKDYRGAFYSAPDTYELVLETSGFAACGAADAFTRFDEGYDTEPKVTFDPVTGVYTTKQDLGDMGIQEFKYKVADGVIATAMRSADEGEYDTVLTYGTITDEDRVIVQTAVDRLQ